MSGKDATGNVISPLHCKCAELWAEWGDSLSEYILELVEEDGWLVGMRGPGHMGVSHPPSSILQELMGWVYSLPCLQFNVCAEAKLIKSLWLICVAASCFSKSKWMLGLRDNYECSGTERCLLRQTNFYFPLSQWWCCVGCVTQYPIQSMAYEITGPDHIIPQDSKESHSSSHLSDDAAANSNSKQIWAL